VSPREQNAALMAWLCSVNIRYVLVHDFHPWTHSAPAANQEIGGQGT
jgi:hypothetical protein